MTISSIDLKQAGRQDDLSLPAFGFGTRILASSTARSTRRDFDGDDSDAAWDAGVRYYDTAPWYGRGLSEHRLGGFLRTKPRDEFKLTTKVGRTLSRPEKSGALRPLAMDRRAQFRGRFRLHL